MSEPTIDELLNSFKTSYPGDAYMVYRLGQELTRLRRRLEIAERALQRISKQESEVKGLRSEFYGHGIAIAEQALDEMERIQ